MNMRLNSFLAIAAAVLCVAATSCKKEIDSKGTKYIKVTGIKLNTESTTVIIGQSEQLVAQIIPSNAYDKKVIWTSSNTSAATVDENGLVTGHYQGVSYITATSASNENIFKRCEVQVVTTPVELQNLSFSQSDYLVMKGAKLSLYPTFTPSNTTERKLQWKSSNPQIADVNQSGVVEGLKNGNTTITVTSQERPSISASVTVQVVVPFSSISITWPTSQASFYNASGDYYELDAGSSFTLQTSTLPADSGDKLVFRSSDSRYVTVSATGVVTGVKYSSSPVTVYVGCQTGSVEEKSIKVKVFDAYAGLKLVIKNTPCILPSDATRPSQYIGAGATQEYTVSVLPTTANQRISLQSWTTNLNCSFQNNTLTVSAKTGVTTSTSSSEATGTVKLYASGAERPVKFYISQYDPYQPKPGDGLWEKLSGSTHYLYFQDSGWRGADIWENPVTLASNNSKVVAIIGHVGTEWCTEDPKAKNPITNATYWSGLYSVQTSLKRGIAIPVNTSRVYASSGSTPHTSGMPFCVTADDLSTQGDVLKSTNEKHTAYANSQLIKVWNDARAGNSWRLQITPYFYCDSQSAWYYGASTSTELNATAPGELAANIASPWLMPTMADLISVFRGGWPERYSSSSGYLYEITDTETMNIAKARVAAFKKSTKLFSGATVNSYNLRWWVSQQYTTSKGLLFNVNDNGQISIKTEDKTASANNYILPILYF